MIILQFVLFFKLIKFKMSNIEEIKIVLKTEVYILITTKMMLYLS